MGANKKKLSSVSKADTLETIGEFWDTHDFTDYDNPKARDVKFEIACAVPIDSELLVLLEHQARRHGIKVETLVNLWLREMLSQQPQHAT